MRKILFILLIFSINANAQTTLLNLSTETSPTYSHYLPIGKSGWTTYKKISLQNILLLEKNERIATDTMIKFGTGLNSYYLYTPNASSNFLKNSDFSNLGYSANLFNADQILDSVLYSIKLGTQLLDTGNFGKSIKVRNANNTAANNNTFVINQYNYASADNSFAKGYNSFTFRTSSTATSSGMFHKAGDAEAMEYVMMAQTTENQVDTFGINFTEYPNLLTDMLSKYTIEIVAVIDSGKAGTIGRGLTQLWQISAVNEAGNSVLIGTADSTTAKRSTSAFNAYITAEIDNTTEKLIIKAHGIPYYKIKWVAYVRETMVGFNNFSH